MSSERIVLAAAERVARRARGVAAESAQGLRAFIRWPRYSVTSHRMVRGLVAQGITPSFVVDVGANKGQFAVAVLELLPDSGVFSLEPLPAARPALDDLVEHYGDRFAWSSVAVGDACGRADLNVNSHDQSSSLLELADRHRVAFPAAHEAGQVTVEVERLDRILATTPIPPDALLKLDIQGSERKALDGAGARLGEFQHIVIETSFSPLYEAEWTFLEAVEHLDARGFTFVRPVGALVDPRNGEYLQVDALFSRAGPR